MWNLRSVRPLGIMCVVLVMASARPSAQGLDTVAPDFSLKTLAGDTVTLSHLRGHPVFLNFWATWCKPCRGEMTDIIAAYDAHHPAGLEVVAINLTDQERMRDVRTFVHELGLPFPVLPRREGEGSQSLCASRRADLRVHRHSRCGAPGEHRPHHTREHAARVGRHIAGPLGRQPAAKICRRSCSTRATSSPQPARQRLAHGPAHASSRTNPGFPNLPIVQRRSRAWFRRRKAPAHRRTPSC